MLSARERWQYDHHGLLHLPGLVAADDVEQMRSAAEHWHSLPDAELPPPLVKSAPSHPNWNDGRISGWVDHPHYRDEAYQRVLLHPEILRIVIGLTGRRPVLIGTSVTMCERGDDAIPLHGGSRPSGGHYRLIAAGSEGHGTDPPPRVDPAALAESLGDSEPEQLEIYDSFINVAVSLVDNPLGAGFVCVPGSHHSHFRMPPVSTEGVRSSLAGGEDEAQDERLISVTDGAPTILNLPAAAGDVIVFSESMCHGARAWDEDYPRFTLFNRFRATSTGSAYSAEATPWHGGEVPEWGELAQLLPPRLLELQAASDTSQPIKQLVLEAECAVVAERAGGAEVRGGAKL
jgi:hypothetical protein